MQRASGEAALLPNQCLALRAALLLPHCEKPVLESECDPTSAYWKYSVCMSRYGYSASISERLLKHNHKTGFWLHRDELLAWRFEVHLPEATALVVA